MQNDFCLPNLRVRGRQVPRGLQVRRNKMNKNHFYIRATPLLVVALLMSACTNAAIFATPTPLPTDTPTPSPTFTPSLTFTPSPTFTASPTATEVPPTSTAAPMGVPVSSGDYEVNVKSVRTLGSVYISNRYRWVATANNMFVELGIKVINSKPGSKLNIYWSDIYVIEENGKTTTPDWGEFKPVASGVEINPKTLLFKELRNPSERVVFDEVVFIRAIYIITKQRPTTILFGFGHSPLIEVVVP